MIGDGHFFFFVAWLGVYAASIRDYPHYNSSKTQYEKGLCKMGST